MFNPKESKSDKYIHNIGLAAIVIFFSMVFLEITRDEAVQYTYLEAYGSRTTALVIGVRRCVRNCQYADIPNFHSEYEFEFINTSNKRVKRKNILYDTDIKAAYGKYISTYNKVEVIFDPDEGGEIVPYKLHENMVVSQTISLVSFLVILLSAFLIIYQIYAFKKFKQRMKYY